MKNVRQWLCLLLPTMLAILIGCGGGGAGSGTSPNALARERVRSGFALSLLGLAQSGASPVGMAAGTSGSTGGGGIGVPFIGAFVHGHGPSTVISGTTGSSGTGDTASTTGDTSGGTTGTTGGTTGSTSGFMFDEYLQLWTETNYTETSWSSVLFEDQGKTKPAGSFQTNYDASGNYTSNFEITAGPFSGAKGRYVTTVNSPNGESGVSEYENTWPTYGQDSGSWTWGPDGSTWRHRSDATDGSWYEYEGSFQANGSGLSSGSDSKGYRYSFVYEADGSGRGRIEGPEPGLPCTITWRADGFTRIVWADGTVEEFDPSDWYGGTTGSGTSGGSSGGTEPGGTSGG